jgi:hypothetical protein
MGFFADSPAQRFRTGPLHFRAALAQAAIFPNSAWTRGSGLILRSRARRLLAPALPALPADVCGNGAASAFQC